MKIKLHKNDLPNSLKLGNAIAIDTEAMGLNHQRDRLCLVQLSKGKDTCNLVQINNIKNKPKNLIALLKNKKVLKIFQTNIKVLQYIRHKI